MDYTWQVPIKAELIECKLTSLGFERKSKIVAYDLGSGAVSIALPLVKQEPDCSYSFTSFKIKEIKTGLLVDKIATAVSFDSITKSLTIDSADISLANSAAEVIIMIE